MLLVDLIWSFFLKMNVVVCLGMSCLDLICDWSIGMIVVRFVFVLRIGSIGM